MAEKLNFKLHTVARTDWYGFAWRTKGTVAVLACLCPDPISGRQLCNFTFSLCIKSGSLCSKLMVFTFYNITIRAECFTKILLASAHR